MENFLLELADLLEVEVAELTAEYQLEENENWDSLALISVVVMMDEHFHLSISNDVLRKCKQVGELLNIIEEQVGLMKS